MSDEYPSMKVIGSLKVIHSLTCKTTVNIYISWNMTPWILVDFNRSICDDLPIATAPR